MNSLAPIVVPARAAHTATIIILHGLGDSGEGWQPVAKMLAPGHPHVKWILPNAPVAPVDVFGGMPAPSWFNIRSISMDDPREDEQGLLSAASNIKEIIADEIAAGVDPKRIVLGGFSQGGALALLTGLTNEQSIGGIVALSTWLPLSTRLTALVSPTHKSTPIFMAHGTDDGVVPYKYGQASYKFLTDEDKLGIPKRSVTDEVSKLATGVVFQTYQGMEHSSDPQELKDLSKWLQGRLP